MIFPSSLLRKVPVTGPFLAMLVAFTMWNREDRLPPFLAAALSE